MTEDTNEPWFDIERRLRDDPGGRERDGLLTRLNEATRTLKRRMDMGAAPNEFAEMEVVCKGLEAASDVVSRVWRRHHPDG